ncbi:MAG: GTP-binding protein TypA/BipA [Candidatus Xenolissoclinum pacificiensis L6]|uniref:50S ribosomal subunit assembly factor BipA n=1 Tax=Candidatus Xenolissoclinum pacificiensis L6 TaxID=1401685 RepID=W2UZ72_9RICK|nr:MAG: GTP-binding protein TypA/BipA [Candidatus Xenolissoclinum pacificiensis L6]
MSPYKNIINIAVIAHVDHGKTTLIDNMLKQTLSGRDVEKVTERAMDSNPLEMERGITIYAKCTSVFFRDTKINIVDTPGHADFGAEVERVLSMTSAVILLVDCVEGPMPQTKFVLSKALKAGLLPIVIINKIDKPDARIAEVLDEVYELFFALEANDEQLDFPVLYASGRDGWASTEVDGKREDLTPLFENILSYAKKEVVTENSEDEERFSMLVTLLMPDPFLGRILVGKVYNGSVNIGSTVQVLNLDGELLDKGKLTKLYTFDGLAKTSVDKVSAGDIVAIAGLSGTSVSDTICSENVDKPIMTTPVDPPTMSIRVSVNDSPFAGKSGTKLTARMIRDRLYAEVENNIAIQIVDSGDSTYEVKGRGELQLGILIESMRREGFEMSVGKPSVVFQYDESGKRLEPLEILIVDVDQEYAGVVMEKMSSRKGEVVNMQDFQDRTRIEFKIPARALIGYQGEFLTDTKGTGIMNHLFDSYDTYRGDFATRRNGVLISMNQGSATGYSLGNLQDRGIMFVAPQDAVYQGMIVGQHNRDNDLEVNITKGKQLSNMRASGSDETVKIATAKEMTLEEQIAYIADDELVEVTPDVIRMRKKYLDPVERKRFSKKKS